MGFGDDLMITATAAKVKKYPESQIVIGNIKKEAYHSIVYDNNPNISDCRKLDPKKPIHIINYHQGNRPYIDYEKSLQKDKYIWNKKYKPTPGEIYFTLSEISIANKIINNAIKFWNKLNKNKFKAIIFLELSSTKLDDIQFGVKHENKSWGFNNWLKLIDNTKDEYLYIQSKHANSKNIEGVYLSENINFREACAVLNKSDLYVGPEGGFGHAAAA